MNDWVLIKELVSYAAWKQLTRHAIILIGNIDRHTKYKYEILSQNFAFTKAGGAVGFTTPKMT